MIKLFLGKKSFRTLSDLNRRPIDYRSDALLTESPKHEATRGEKLRCDLEWQTIERPSCPRGDKLFLFLVRITSEMYNVLRT